MQSISENITTEGLRNVSYPVAGYEDGEGYLTSEPKEGSLGLVLIQEWWGMNKNITLAADRWAQAGDFCVLCPDLYRGKVGKDYKEAGHLRSGLDWVGAIANVGGAITFFREKGCKKVFLTGFCMGGALAISVAASDIQPDASVTFYGVPDLNNTDLSKVKSPIQVIFGAHDKVVGFSDVTAREKLTESFQKTEAKYEIKVVDAGHAFMNPDRDTYNPEIAKISLEESIAFFRGQL